MTPKLEEHLITWEGWRPKAYKCPVGHWTIGVGFYFSFATQENLTISKIEVRDLE